MKKKYTKVTFFLPILDVNMKKYTKVGKKPY